MTRPAMYDNNQVLIECAEHCDMAKLKIADAVAYLEKRGFPMSERTYSRLLTRIREDTQGRLSYIAYKEFAGQHIRSIDTINNLVSSMYKMATDESLQPHARIRAADVVNNLIKTKTELYDGTPIVAAIAEELNRAKIQPKANATGSV